MNPPRPKLLVNKFFIFKTVPDNNASGKVAFLHPLKMQLRKKQ